MIDWLIDWLRDWCLTSTLVIIQLGDIWTPQIANKCIITSYQDRCNFLLTGVLWKEPILLLYISSDRPSFVNILRRKIHACSKCKMPDGSSEWVIVVLLQLSNLSAILWWEQVNFQWNDDEVRFVLDQRF